MARIHSLLGNFFHRLCIHAPNSDQFGAFHVPVDRFGPSALPRL
jgi:hypothetical protein